MATLQELESALLNADAAGDVAAATLLANELVTRRNPPVEDEFSTMQPSEPYVDPDDQSFLREVADVPLKVGQGAVMGIRMISDAFGANNAFSQSLRVGEDYIAGLLSAQSKEDSQEIARIMAEAEDKGVADQVIAGLKAFSVAPIDFVTNALGTAAPAIAAGALTAVTGGAAPSLLAGAAALAGTGAVMGAGVTKGSIYEAVSEGLAEGGEYSDEEIDRIADDAQEYIGDNTDMILSGTLLGALASRVGANPVITNAITKRLTGKIAVETSKKAGERGLLRRVGSGAAREGLPEFAQGAQEQLAANLAQQRVGMDTPTLRGVAGSGTLEGLAGAGLGGITSVKGEASPQEEEQGELFPVDTLSKQGGATTSAPSTRENFDEDVDTQIEDELNKFTSEEIDAARNKIIVENKKKKKEEKILNTPRNVLKELNPEIENNIPTSLEDGELKRLQREEAQTERQTNLFGADLDAREYALEEKADEEREYQELLKEEKEKEEKEYQELLKEENEKRTTYKNFVAETDARAKAEDKAKVDKNPDRIFALNRLLDTLKPSDTVEDAEEKFSLGLDELNVAKGDRALPTKEEKNTIAKAVSMQQTWNNIIDPNNSDNPETQPEVITDEFMDDLGISSTSYMRRLVGMDFNDSDIKKEFVSFANDTINTDETRLAVARLMENTPEEQLELSSFTPTQKKKDVTPREVEVASAEDTLNTLGVPPRAAIRKRVKALSSNNPKFITELEAYNKLPKTPKDTKNKIDLFLEKEGQPNDITKPSVAGATGSGVSTNRKPRRNNKNTEKPKSPVRAGVGDVGKLSSGDSGGASDELGTLKKPVTAKKKVVAKKKATEKVVAKKKPADEGSSKITMAGASENFITPDVAKDKKKKIALVESKQKKATKKDVDRINKVVAEAGKPKTTDSSNDELVAAHSSVIDAAKEIRDNFFSKVNKAHQLVVEYYNKSEKILDADADPTTINRTDNTRVWFLVRLKATQFKKDPEGKAAHTYFSKYPTVIEAMQDIAFDSFGVNSKGEKTKKSKTSVGTSDAETEFFKGTNAKQAILARAWIAKNLSAEAESKMKSLLETERKENQSAKANAKQRLKLETEEKIKADNKKDGEKDSDILNESELTDLYYTVQNKIIVLEKKAKTIELTTDEKRQLENAKKQIEDINATFNDSNKPLTLEAVLSFSRTLHPIIKDFLKGNNLSDALGALAVTIEDSELSKVARKLQSVVGSTKVEIVSNLKDRGVRVAGLFDPKTNTIKLDADAGLNAHTLMHEMTHAAVSAELGNSKSVMRKRLVALYEGVKPFLDSEYGLTNVDEFVSEAMSNPEFRKSLAGIYLKEGDSLLTRFVNIIKSIFVPVYTLSKEVGSKTVLDEVTVLVDIIADPAPSFRNSLPYRLNLFGGPLEVKKIFNGMKESVPNKISNSDLSSGVLELLTKANTKIKQGYLGALNSLSLGDIAKKTGFGDLGYELHDAIERLGGSVAGATKAVEEVLAAAEKSFFNNKNITTEQKDAFNNLVYDEEYGATINDVDPTLSNANAIIKYGQNSDKYKVWKEQRKDWNLIGPAGHKVYKDLRKMYRDNWIRIRDHLNNKSGELLSPTATEEQKAEFKKQLTTLIKSGVIGEYFPLYREGEYVLKIEATGAPVKGEPSYIVRRFKYKNDAETAKKELEKDAVNVTLYDNTVSLLESNQSDSNFNLTPYLDLLKKNKVSSEIQNQIVNLFVSKLPEKSLLKQTQRRLKTPGYVKDVLAVAKIRGYQLAQQAVRIEGGSEIRAIGNKIKEKSALLEKEPELEANSIIGKWAGVIKPTVVAKEMLERVRIGTGGVNDSLERTWKGFNQVAFIYTIAFNAASALVQGGQIPLVVFPMLGGRYGMDKTQKAIYDATGLVFSSSVGAKSESIVGKAIDKISIAYGLDSYYDVAPDGSYVVRKDLNLPAKTIEFLENLDTLVQFGVTQGQFTNSNLLAAINLEAGGRTQQGNAYSRISGKVAAIGAMAFNQVDRANRQVTLVSAYTLELNKLKADNPDANIKELKEKAAKEAIYQAQFLNGSAVRETSGRFSQEGVVQVGMMYKSFGINMYYMMMKTAKYWADNSKSTDPEIDAERKIAFKQIMGIFGTSALAAGLVGTPVFGAIQLIADLMFLDEEDDDFLTLTRKTIEKGTNVVGLGGTGLSELITKGPINAITGFSVADRLRLSGLLVQQNRFNQDASLEEDILFYLGGPALSVGKRAIRGVADIKNGDVQRGIESLLPAGMSNIYKVLTRYNEDGSIKTRRDDTMYDISGWEMFGQMVGFSPAQYIREQEITQRDKRVSGAIATRKSTLLKKYYVALRQHDFEYADKITKDIIKFNKEYPSLALSTKDINKSMKAHDKTSGDMFKGVTLPKNQISTISKSRRALGDSLFTN